MPDLATLETVRAVLGMLIAGEQAIMGLILLLGAVAAQGSAPARFPLILGILFLALSGDRWIISPVLGSDRTVLDVEPWMLFASCLWLSIAFVAGLVFIFLALSDLGSRIEGNRKALEIVTDTNRKVTDMHETFLEGNGETKGPAHE